MLSYILNQNMHADIQYERGFYYYSLFMSEYTFNTKKYTFVAYIFLMITIWLICNETIWPQARKTIKTEERKTYKNPNIKVKHFTLKLQENIEKENMDETKFKQTAALTWMIPAKHLRAVQIFVWI